MYGNEEGHIIGLNKKLNDLIKAVEKAVQKMDKTGYSNEVKEMLNLAVEKARRKKKS
jgi:hypothetical protein